jgi:spore coat polysaccharide biosynthesis protein SpsF
MTSQRLPGKVLMDLHGVPMVGRVVERTRSAGLVDDIWIACTDRRDDDPLAAYAESIGCRVFRGSEQDVLSRFVAIAGLTSADRFVRLTADCPLLDGAVIDRVVGTLAGGDGLDYVANVLERSFPRGLDVEAFTRDALMRLDRLGVSEQSREHVTVAARMEHPEAFVMRNVRAATDDSDLRWTVDTMDDLEFVRVIYRALSLDRGSRPYGDLVRWCRANATWIRKDEPHHTWDPSRRVSSQMGG